MDNSDSENEEIKKLKNDKPRMENKLADILRGYDIKENVICNIL